MNEYNFNCDKGSIYQRIQFSGSQPLTEKLLYGTKWCVRAVIELTMMFERGPIGTSLHKHQLDL